ncbi:MAG: SusC/RagA family TonB-linked outer membrane protein, partial [Flavobacteriaceae bacterium]|nr:SusC/RagA family TonB-linked outer membrane protein [Flavobacteriaceae bacterium]
MRNNLSKKLLLLVFILAGIVMYGQRTVKGVVSDSSGSLPGVTVQEKGTSNGTQTDLDGNYTITVSSDSSTLVFSYLGYKTQKITVDSRSIINMMLVEDSTQLDEIVVIGYGQTTVRDATGSVTAVTSADFNRGVVASPEQLIQGKAAGVNIQQTSGEPGAGIQVNIRGTSSVRANNNPLFVVDGIPLSGENIEPAGDSGNGASSPRNPLNFLNPNDIESISILKDASATAIYGSRGANGVVIITTKSGKAGAGGVFEFNTDVSFSTPANEYDLLNRDQFLSAILSIGNNSASVDFGENTDYQNFVTRDVASRNYNLSYSKNYGKGNVRATFGYGQQLGVVQNTDLERITGRVNGNHRFLDDKLKVSVNATVSRLNNETAPLSASADFRGDILGAAYSANPTWPSDPDFNDGGTQIKPANLLEYSQNVTNTNRLLLNGSLTYDISDDLSAKVNLGYDKSDGTNITSLSSKLISDVVGSGVYNVLERESKLVETTLTWNKKLSE